MLLHVSCSYLLFLFPVAASGSCLVFSSSIPIAYLCSLILADFSICCFHMPIRVEYIFQLVPRLPLEKKIQRVMCARESSVRGLPQHRATVHPRESSHLGQQRGSIHLKTMPSTAIESTFAGAEFNSTFTACGSWRVMSKDKNLTSTHQNSSALPVLTRFMREPARPHATQCQSCCRTNP